MWLNINQEGLRRFWSMLPLTRVPFWYRFFEPQPCVFGRPPQTAFTFKARSSVGHRVPRLAKVSAPRGATAPGPAKPATSGAPGIRRSLRGCRAYPRNLHIPGLFSGYHVDPLLKKEVFTMKNQVFTKNTLKKAGILSRG